MKQKIFTLLAACIVCAGTISAEIIERVSIGDLMYNLDTEKAVAEVTYRTQDQTNYSTLSGAVVIPEIVEYAESTFRVTSIGMGAFAFCENISTITLPVTITNIGMYAFHECHSLSSINLPEGLVSIGEAAFYKCGSLLPITIPSTLTTFGLHPFVDCVNMTKVTILSNSVVSAVYTKASNLSHVFGKQVTEIVMGEGVTAIGEYAFNGFVNLQKVTIPSSVESIGNSAFGECVLKDVNINSNSIIGAKYSKYSGTLAGIFGDAVENYYLGDDVTTIGDCAFYNATNIKSLHLPANLSSIGAYAFSNCSNIPSFNLPAQMTSIGEGAFDKCTGLTGEFSFPEGIEILSAYVLQDCSGITSVKLPNTLKEIYTYALAGCDITELTLPASLTGIGMYGLADCKGLTSLTCLATTPPEAEKYAFLEIDCPNTPLYVPEGSVEAYQNAEEWKKFNPILPIASPTDVEQITNDELPATVKILRNNQIFLLRGDKVYTLQGQEVK